METKEKRLRLVIYWLFSAVMIVFAAVTSYIALWSFPLGASVWMVLGRSLPITLIVAVAAGILFAIYYFVIYKKETE